MIAYNVLTCPTCGGTLKYYDNIQRIVRTKGGKIKWIKVRRLRCPSCRTLHREIPDYIFPYKQYKAEIIRGVLEGFITSEILGYEDYPCEMTMVRWETRKTQILLWKG